MTFVELADLSRLLVDHIELIRRDAPDRSCDHRLLNHLTEVGSGDIVLPPFEKIVGVGIAIHEPSRSCVELLPEGLILVFEEVPSHLIGEGGRPILSADDEDLGIYPTPSELLRDALETLGGDAGDAISEMDRE